MKKIYLFFSSLYLIKFIVEIIYYFGFNSSLYGLLYNIINLVVLTILILTSYNYEKGNVNFRVSKNIFLVFIILFCILILPKFNYIDESFAFINKTKLFIYYINTGLITILTLISFLDFKFKNKAKNKIDKNYNS